jgi:hypothetical protein
MAAVKTADNSGTKYHVSDPQGNHVVLQPGQRPGTIQLASGSNVVALSQQNVTDYLAALTAFVNTGVLS